MEEGKGDRAELSEDGSVEAPRANTKQAWVQQLIHSSILEIRHNVAWHDHMVVDMLLFKETDDGWLGMVKGHMRGLRRVAFVSAETYAEVAELTAEFARRGCLTWQVDKWPPKRQGP